MKKALLNWRYYLMTAIWFVALVGIFSVPDEGMKLGRWVCHLLISKAIGFGAAYAFYRLAEYWRERDLLPEMDGLILEED